MISLTGRRSSTVIILILFGYATGETRVPTLTEISHINDPVLREVFASSGIPNKSGAQPEFENSPRLPQKIPYHSPQKRIYYGEIPIEHNQPLGPLPYREEPMPTMVDTGVSALANGANVLYRGAATVGQAFGINPQTYEAPLFQCCNKILRTPMIRYD